MQPIQELLVQLNDLKQVTIMPLKFIDKGLYPWAEKYFIVYKDMEHLQEKKELCLFNMDTLQKQSWCKRHCNAKKMAKFIQDASNICDLILKILQIQTDCMSIFLNCIQCMHSCYEQYFQCKSLQQMGKMKSHYDKPAITYCVEIEQNLQNEKIYVKVPKMYQIETECQEHEAFIKKSGLGDPVEVIANLFINGEQQGLLQQYEKFPVKIDKIVDQLNIQNNFLNQVTRLAFKQVYYKLDLQQQVNAIYIGDQLEGTILHGFDNYSFFGIKGSKSAHHILLSKENEVLNHIIEESNCEYKIFDRTQSIVQGNIKIDFLSSEYAECLCSTFNPRLPLFTIELNFEKIKSPMHKLMMLYIIPYISTYSYKHVMGMFPRLWFNNICNCCMRQQQKPIFNNKVNIQAYQDFDESLFIKDNYQLICEDVEKDLYKVLASKNLYTLEQLRNNNIKNVEEERLLNYSQYLQNKNNKQNTETSMVSAERPLIESKFGEIN